MGWAEAHGGACLNVPQGTSVLVAKVQYPSSFLPGCMYTHVSVNLLGCDCKQ